MVLRTNLTDTTEQEGVHAAQHNEVNQAVLDHLADTVDAHDASAISFSPASGIAATNVQAAIVEVLADIEAGDVDSVDGRTGTVTLSDLYAALAGTYAAVGTDVITAKVTGNANSRFILNADGKIEWGDGTAAIDTNLYRSAANVLTTDDSLVIVGDLTLSASDIITDTTTGTKIGTATTQKLGFFNATPVVQQTGSSDVLGSLVTLGLRAASSNPPLNLGTGALTAGTTGVGALTATSIAGTGTVALTGTMTISDGINIVVNATTGTKIGTATTQKIGFFNATPVVQQTGSSDVLASLVTLGLRAASSNPPLNLGTGALTAGTTGVGALTATSVVGTGTIAITGTATITDAMNIVVGTTTGTKIGTATTQKIGFYNATPVVQPSAYTQTYATADKTLSAYTPDSESAAYTGAADSEAKLVDLNALRVAYENLRAFVEDLAGVVNSHTDDLQALGLVG